MIGLHAGHLTVRLHALEAAQPPMDSVQYLAVICPLFSRPVSTKAERFSTIRIRQFVASCFHASIFDWEFEQIAEGYERATQSPEQGAQSNNSRAKEQRI
jgi:hypothetical protein